MKKFPPYFLPLGVILALLPSTVAGSGITLVDVPHLPSYPDATASTIFINAAAPNALQFACSSSAEELERFFESEEAPFRRELIRVTGGTLCHILYTPTVPGFRASTEDDTVSELLFDANQLMFLTKPKKNYGDPFGAVKEVLRGLRQPLTVGFLINQVHDAAVYETVKQLNFGKFSHRIELWDKEFNRAFWWIQDCLESGYTKEGDRVLLIPFRIFEGNPENGAALEPLIRILENKLGAVRSKVAWEGGDLTFTRDPRDPDHLVMFYGHFVKPYWGQALTDQEFEYVLALEFGAQRAVDLSGLAPHIDYFAAFLPDQQTVLVSVPRTGDLQVARTVQALLQEEVAGDQPLLRELAELLSHPEPESVKVLSLLKRIRAAQVNWAFQLDPDFLAQMKSFVGEVCPGQANCFSPAGQLRMSQANPELFGEWIQAVESSRDEQVIIRAYLDLTESQFEPVHASLLQRTEQKISELEALGFTVIRVPAYRVDLHRERSWVGVSYTNCLVIDKQIFIPEFGLREVEERIFEDLGSRLPQGYSVVPVFARRLFVRAGGLHCIAGIIRHAD